MSDQSPEPKTVGEPFDQGARRWRPPPLRREGTRSTGEGVGLALLSSSASSSGESGHKAAGEARRWHEANDAGGLSALLGGRRPVCLKDEVAEGFTSAPNRDDAAPVAPAPASPVEIVQEGPPGNSASGPAVAASAAMARAHAEGFAAGEASAREAFAVEFAALARCFVRERQIALDTLEDELAALARSMAACAMRRELRSDPGALLVHVRDALDALVAATGSTAPVTVRMHPRDAAAMGETLGTEVHVVADASLARTDCRLERGAARLDASIRARLDAIGLDEALRDASGEQSPDEGGNTGGDIDHGEDGSEDGNGGTREGMADDDDAGGRS